MMIITPVNILHNSPSNTRKYLAPNASSK